LGKKTWDQNWGEAAPYFNSRFGGRGRSHWL